jgi:amidase
MGIGTDVGGSIRSPAANNGLYGLKPTAFRIPTEGWSSIACNVDFINTCVGPLSTSLTGIELFMQTIISAEPWLSEPALVPMPWRPEHALANGETALKIAVMYNDAVVVPHPPLQRALKTLVEKLKRLPNVEIVVWNADETESRKAWEILSHLYYPDGGAEDEKWLAKSGEPWMPLSEWIIRENEYAEVLDMEGLQEWQEEREAFRMEFAQRWNELGASTDSRGNGIKPGRDKGKPVDAILCPVGPSAAPRLGTAKYWNYTSLWNLLDFPALVFPVTAADKDVDKQDEKWEWLSQEDERNYGLCELSSIASVFFTSVETYYLGTDYFLIDDPIDYHGMPVNLQLVGRRFDDEKIVAILKYIESKIELPFNPSTDFTDQ